MTRRIVTLDIGGERVIGTHHVARGPARDIGFVLTNAGYVPRDGHGGLSTVMCDALAQAGFHAFRFDMPGLGDAPGFLPNHALELFDHVTSGGYAKTVLGIAKELKARYGIRAIVPGGMCGAAVTAIWVADRDPDAVAGLVLLEPELFRSDEEKTTDLDWLGNARRKLFAYWGWMRVLTMENRWARFMPLPRKTLLDVFGSRDRLPTVTNFELAAAWRRVVARKTPILVLTASGKLREVFLDRVNRVALANLPTDHVRHERLAETNHIFTTGRASARVRDHVLRWARDVWGPELGPLPFFPVDTDVSRVAFEQRALADVEGE
jgi:hypothetical protein